MGILDAPGLNPGQNEHWEIFASRPVKLGTSATTPTSNASTTRLSEVAPYAAKAVRLIYANWQNVSGIAEAPNYTPIRVAATVHRAGTSAPNLAATDPLYRVRFRGNRLGYIDGGDWILSDPIPVSLNAGERWWHESYVDTLLGAGPASPTLTAVASGGTFASGYTIYMVLTYVYPDGTESLPSVEVTATTSAVNSSFQVTAPPAAPGVVGYRIYWTNGAAGGIKGEHPNYPMQPLGSNTTITAPLSAVMGIGRIARTIANVGYPLGGGLLDATTGEAQVGGRDYTENPIAWTASGNTFSGVFSPIGVLALPANGTRKRTVVLLGDSIQAGTGDRGYGGNIGGFAFRAAANQTAQNAYDPTKTPKLGFLTLAQGGETAASFATEAGGSRRRQISEYGTTIVSNYGTNDTGTGSAPLYASLYSIYTFYAGRKSFFHTTLLPKATTSTDGWKTVAGQTIASTDAEADRRAINNCLRGSSGATTVTGETLYRSPTAGTATTASSLYSGGDGTAVKFYTAYPFRTGTETIQVNGATQAVTTNYTYRQTAVIGGVTYASGIVFTTAPGNAATVTGSYTKAPSFGSYPGFAGVLDIAATVEVDGTGTPALNGGFWPAALTGISNGTVTGYTSALITDSSKTWTVDQWRGWIVRIVSDSTTPAAVGQTSDIQSNTATTLKLGGAFGTAPSTAATYEIIGAYTVDGTHPTSLGHRTIGAAIDTSRF